MGARKPRKKRSISYFLLPASITTSNIRLFTCVSIHQGHERLGDLSRGRQCAFISLSTLLCDHGFPIQLWTSKTVENIILRADRMYQNALANHGNIPDAYSPLR